MDTPTFDVRRGRFSKRLVRATFKTTGRRHSACGDALGRSHDLRLASEVNESILNPITAPSSTSVALNNADWTTTAWGGEGGSDYNQMSIKLLRYIIPVLPNSDKIQPKYTSGSNRKY